MTANDQLQTPGQPFKRLEYQLTRLLYIDGEKLAYLVIFVLAIVTRFWDLGVRVMSHDESLHTKYSWDLYRGNGFAHTPLMHGPLLFHAVAFSYLLFGDNDFTARIYPALLGVAVVMIPFFMRRWLGKLGSLSASFFFLISPLILYYSRYIRHDIPAILAALVIAVCIWRYIEDRKFWYLIAIGIAQVVLFASKEVSFIYIAIFGSFLTLYMITRLFEVHWENAILRRVFAISVVIALVASVAFGAALTLAGPGGPLEIPSADITAAPADPTSAVEAGTDDGSALPTPALLALVVLGLAIIALGTSALIGQWPNLRRFPELDVMMTMGTLVLPSLAPFLIHFAGFNPMDSSQEGVAINLGFTLPVFLLSILIGLIYFMQAPVPRRVSVDGSLTDDDLAALGNRYDPNADTVAVEPDVVDWLSALFVTNRWWAIGGLYWLIFTFFFTTMFTNANGIGTGVVGSLGYWLEQQDVKRGNQPGYYYLVVMIPLYEFLPAILSSVAAGIGLKRWLFPGTRNRATAQTSAATEDMEDEGEVGEIPADDSAEPEQILVQPDGPIDFPVLQFSGYWAVLNLIGYSLAGEKMPWLTTHLTVPLILISGWVVGQLLTRIKWQKLWQDNSWLILLLLPVAIVALLRVVAPVCSVWQANPLCNTVMPSRYQTGLFEGRTVDELSTSGLWLTAFIVLAGITITLVRVVRRTGLRLLTQLLAVLAIGWLTFITARSAWSAAFINFDLANEYLVYAHSSGAVQDVMDQIEEISYKTTDGLGLRVAYDDRVSWPMTWYFRDYYNAVYYGSQPSRGLLGDAPVILAGPSNWPKVEELTGNRYYQFEYIRMWWPMQDYFDLTSEDFRNVATDPELQRGIWNIFTRRDYEVYADAVTKYRANNSRPSFELSQWPVAERMRLYIRKDVFAQVWDYGVAASEIAEAVDPYAQNVRQLTPDARFGAGMLNAPHGLDVGPDGNLYVADTNNHRILVLDSAGQIIEIIGTHAMAPTLEGLNEPWDVAVGPDGTVFVADTWNHRVSRYSPDGEFELTWGVEGPNEMENTAAFWGPRGIDVDAQGRVYVADTGNKRVMVYDEDGNYLRQIGSPGTFEGELDEPTGIVAGLDGMLYVADTWNQRIQVFTQEGIFMRSWPIDAWFAQTNERPYLAVDAQGIVYVTDPSGARILVFNNIGQYLYSFGDFSIIGLAGGIEVDQQGRLYLVDTQNNEIQQYQVQVNSSPVQ